ncbi:type II/IV secretion system ATPase subunit [Staphylothermus hellenicus]|uniref:Type II secretion system protein E n=1 Tax=Staphylothermus hellenicus (strain DSM 12710 / JCM 10830 / BK20S6-10-b1 / P8) TaxID=591019 RepID=D7D8I8_STAHD|nr:type II/IV secretion system ATPase subunit [Staphylothermus hellenicus]ADI32084.1 type II secretion system protein E [Staphylothermus hellenicus DSM 12710]
MQSLRKILSRFSRGEEKRRLKKIPGEEEVSEAVKSIIVPVEPIQVAKRDPSWRIIESYYVYKPFVKVIITETPQGPMYFVEEYGLTPSDKEVLEKLTNILMDEIRPPTRPEDIKDLKGYVFKETERIADKYREKLGLVGARRIKLLYYIERNLLGYGPIDPLMRDPNIEDISCNGVNIPIYVWHKKYESIPTNITFIDEDYLNEFVMKMAHMAGKHISIAFPILDAMLPEKHRLAATFGREVSVKGPTFTIRKFREKPFSVTEIIQSGVINSLVAAYLWTLIEHGKTAMIAGGTGVGKTTMLNVVSMFIRPGMKIVTIEDTPEINLPHPNWVQLTSRETYLVGTSSLGTNIRLFDLVKLSLRYRPDYIIVGEVRGEEAFVLFQAMATGHGGLSTIHAETLDYAIKRLTSPPMNIPPTYMKLMNTFIHLQRVIARIEKGVVKVRRRATIVQEVEDFGKYRTIAVWDPRTDQFKVNLEESIHLRDIAAKRGLELEDIIDEIYRKATVLNWMIYKNILNVWDVSRIIFNYYYDPASVYKRAVRELEEAGREKGVSTMVAPEEVASTEELVGGTKEMGEATKELFERTRELGK